MTPGSSLSLREYWQTAKILAQKENPLTPLNLGPDQDLGPKLEKFEKAMARFQKASGTRAQNTAREGVLSAEQQVRDAITNYSQYIQDNQDAFDLDQLRILSKGLADAIKQIEDRELDLGIRLPQDPPATATEVEEIERARQEEERSIEEYEEYEFGLTGEDPHTVPPEDPNDPDGTGTH